MPRHHHRQHRLTFAAPAGVALLLAALLAGWARPAAAQTSLPERGFLAINGGLQTTVSSFIDKSIFDDTDPGRVYIADPASGASSLKASAGYELALLDTSYAVDRGTLFDVSGGFRIGRTFGIGVGASRSVLDVDGSIEGQAPHPFRFSRDRAISAPSCPADVPCVPRTTREEIAVHLQFFSVLPLGDAVTVTLFFGPAWFNVRQDTVSDVQITHTYPYDTAAFAGTSTAAQNRSAFGASAGADVAWFFSRRAGIGWLTRYSRSRVPFETASGGELDVDVGGLHTSAGLRFRF